MSEKVSESWRLQKMDSNQKPSEVAKRKKKKEKEEKEAAAIKNVPGINSFE